MCLEGWEPDIKMIISISANIHRQAVIDYYLAETFKMHAFFIENVTIRMTSCYQLSIRSADNIEYQNPQDSIPMVPESS